MTDYSELTRLADRVLTDRRFCGDENHKALAGGVLAMTAENERVVTLNHQQFGMALQKNREIDELKAQNEALRKVANELRRWASCEHLHHDKVDQHGSYEPCKVLARIDKALSKEG